MHTMVPDLTNKFENLNYKVKQEIFENLSPPNFLAIQYFQTIYEFLEAKLNTLLNMYVPISYYTCINM